MMHFFGNRHLQQWGPLVARVLLALLFIMAGIGKLTGFEGTVGYIASVGLPMPELLTILAILIEVGGGLALMLGFLGRIAAKALFIFTFLTILIFHHNLADQMQSTMALKNLAIMGGLLMVMIHGTGPKSMKSETTSTQAM